MLVVRGTKKLRLRCKGVVAAGESDTSTTVLGDWFANVLFWRPQVVLLVNERTYLPVFLPLAPAATLIDRIPAAIESVLRAHGVGEGFLTAEREAMREVRVAATNNRRVVGVMNEFAFVAEQHQMLDSPQALEELSLRLARLIVGPLMGGAGTPGEELAAVLRTIDSTMAKVIPFPAAATPDTRPAPAKGGSVYQVKVTLQDTKPPVWRRLLIDSTATLDRLHEVIQAAFGWWGYHLHEFEINKARYGVPDPDDDWGTPCRDERKARLDRLAKVGTSFAYTYDFGDNWRHKVTVEKELNPDPATAVPACIDGRRACPPEDCGGTWGYRDLLEVLADPAHPEHDEHRTWIGRPFDPETFDPADFAENLKNARLAAFDD